MRCAVNQVGRVCRQFYSATRIAVTPQVVRVIPLPGGPDLPWPLFHRLHARRAVDHAGDAQSRCVGVVSRAAVHVSDLRDVLLNLPEEEKKARGRSARNSFTIMLSMRKPSRYVLSLLTEPSGRDL